MLKRKIEKELESWKNSKYALMVYGARQVGKTYILKEYLNNNFNCYYYLNLHENVNAIKTIIESSDCKDFILRLSALSNEVDINKCDCIFIDEIQEYYTYLEKHKEIELYFDLISESKYLIEMNKRIVYSGSLLRIELNNLITNPVGYMLPLEMYPLDFEEFLWASGVNDDLINLAYNCMKELKPIPNYLHDKLMNLFRKYILVGGMPQAVNEFINQNSFVAVENAHKAIDYFINEDITKYVSDNEKLKVKEIYKLIPTELSNPSRKFIMSHIEGHNKNDNEILSFTWLNNAGTTIPVYVSKEPLIPLKISSERNQLKLFHEDVGLLTYLLFNYDAKAKILNREIIANLGAVYENAVAQNLYAHGFNELYYYNSKKYGEVDFLVEYQNEVLPIEVKSGKVKYHRALNNIMDIENYHLNKAICFYDDNIKVENKIIYYPIYLCTFLKKR